MKSVRWIAASIGLLGPAAAAVAHHSYTEFDQMQTVEIEGTLTVVAWQNPHTRLEVSVRDSNGSIAAWDIETGAVNAARRRGVRLDAYEVGDSVKLAGWPSKRSANRMFATNLLTDGSELMFQTRTRRWPEAELYPLLPSTSTLPVADVAPTLFRVWTISPDDPDTFPGFLNRSQYSLTEAAKQAVAAFDPVTQSVSTGCTPKGMPLLMGQPFPIEFEDHGDTILLRLEEYDAVRTIYMPGAAHRAPQEASPLGRSLGRWDNGTLVVETDLIDTPYFSSTGIPLSRAARTVERFALSNDGGRLVYNLTATDPATFILPAQAMRAWVARDGEQLLPFDCKPPRY
jgi:hypothetical protein